MENKPVVRTGYRFTFLRGPQYRLARWALLTIAVLALAAVGYVVISKLATSTKNSASTEKVLTVADLDSNNPKARLTSETSDASVENLTKQLETKIDKQIAAKENPFDTVNQLAGILANTVNGTRQSQMADFVEDFLANHEDTLSYATESGHPDQAQINYWKAELYAKLVYNYQSMAQSKFTGSDGKPVDTAKKQLKYANLYLALANDPASHPPIPEEDKGIIVGYIYEYANDFSEMKNTLTQEGAAQ